MTLGDVLRAGCTSVPVSAMANGARVTAVSTGPGGSRRMVSASNPATSLFGGR
ncbi:MAG: hypothetical protein WDM89_00200 [Rhizomicrobium sp.]